MNRQAGYALTLMLCVLGDAPHAVAAAVNEPAGRVQQVARQDPFPQPSALRPAIDFWKKVFAVWDRGRVAIHDDRHLGLIYEVIELPGDLGEVQTAAQRAHVEQRMATLRRELQRLQQHRAAGTPLTGRERALLEQIEAGAGKAALSGAEHRLRSQRGMRERFFRGVELSGRYDAIFRRIFRTAGLPEDLALLPHVESSFQPFARSSVGAAGVWQFMPATGRRYLTMTGAIDERLDPVAAAAGAARYLAEAHDTLGDWALALTSYNHGVGGMARAKAQFGADFAAIVQRYQGRAFGFASRNFYVEFLAVRELMSELEQHAPRGFTKEPPLDRDYQPMILERSTPSHHVAKRHGVKLAQLTAANPAWTRAGSTGRTPLPKGVTVWVPRGTALAQDATELPEIDVALAEDAVDQADRTDPPAEEQSAERARTRESRYQVRRGDTLSAIAARVGVGVAELRNLNRLPRSGMIRVGQSLRIPADGAAPATLAAAQRGIATTHVVRAGDTLSRIAGRHGVSVATLAAANDLDAAGAIIRPGQKLRLPVADGRATVAKTAPKSRLHVVRKGDSAYKIATSYGIKLSSLMEENDLGRRAVLRPGQRLRIPTHATLN